MRLLSIAALLILASASAAAQESSGCDKFKWPLDKERATLNGGRLDRPLLLCLDEAGNVAPLPNLAEIASTAPSHNIQLVTIFHDLAQAREALSAVLEALDIPHPATVGDGEVRDRIVMQRVLHTVIFLRGILADSQPAEDAAWSLGYFRDKLAQHPAEGYRTWDEAVAELQAKREEGSGT